MFRSVARPAVLAVPVTGAWALLWMWLLMVVTPVIVLFLLAQRTFIQGIATTGIKG